MGKVNYSFLIVLNFGPVWMAQIPKQIKTRTCLHFASIFIF